MIKKKIFKSGKQKGSGLLSVLSFNGERFSSTDIEERVPVISVSSIDVNPIDPAYTHWCAKYNDAYKNIQVAALTPKKKVRAVRAMRRGGASKEQRALNEAGAALSRVIKKAKRKKSRSPRGKILGIAR